MGGAETTGKKVGMPLQDARLSSQGVELVTLGGIGRNKGLEVIRPRGAGENVQREGGGGYGGESRSRPSGRGWRSWYRRPFGTDS